MGTVTVRKGINFTLFLLSGGGVILQDLHGSKLFDFKLVLECHVNVIPLTFQTQTDT